MKYIKIISLTLLIFIICGCSKDDSKLIMVTEAGFAPYEFYEGGKIVGVDIEIGKEIAKALNKELVVKDIAFNSIIDEIKSGKADFAAAGISITEERKKQVDFTIEYAVSNQVVVIAQNSKIKNINDIKDKTISVQLGSVADQYATKNYKNAKIIEQKTYLAAAEDVKSGKSDCIIMDMLPARELIASNQELKILDGTLFTDKYGMVVKKGNKELLDTINEVLNRLIQEGKIDEYTIYFSNK